MKPSERIVLDILQDKQPHSAIEFKSGLHGVFVDAVSQRVGDLRRRGYAIDNVTKNGGIATYLLRGES